MRCDPLASQIVVRDELLRKDRIFDRVPHVLGHPGRPAPGEKLRGNTYDVNPYHAQSFGLYYTFGECS